MIEEEKGWGRHKIPILGMNKRNTTTSPIYVNRRIMEYCKQIYPNTFDKWETKWANSLKNTNCQCWHKTKRESPNKPTSIKEIVYFKILLQRNANSFTGESIKHFRNIDRSYINSFRKSKRAKHVTAHFMRPVLLWY